MIKNYKTFNEGLLDKLEGFSKEDIKKNFLKGEVRIDKYIQTCKENGWELPTHEECKALFLNGKINVDKYIQLCDSNDWKKPSEQEIMDSVLKETPSNMLWYSLKNSFLPGVKKAIELGVEITDGSLEFLNRNMEMGLKDMTTVEYEIVKLLLSKGIIPTVNYFENLVYSCFPENKILINIIKLLLDRLVQVKEIDKLDFNKLYEYCEDNKNKELLELLKSYSNEKFTPSKKKWYEKVFKSNESLLDKLKGPSKEERLEYLETLDSNAALIKSCEDGFLPGVLQSIKRGAKIFPWSKMFFEGIVNADCSNEIKHEIIKILLEGGFNPNRYHLWNLGSLISELDDKTRNLVIEYYNKHL